MSILIRCWPCLGDAPAGFEGADGLPRLLRLIPEGGGPPGQDWEITTSMALCSSLITTLPSMSSLVLPQHASSAELGPNYMVLTGVYARRSLPLVSRDADPELGLDPLDAADHGDAEPHDEVIEYMAAIAEDFALVAKAVAGQQRRRGPRPQPAPPAPHVQDEMEAPFHPADCIVENNRVWANRPGGARICIGRLSYMLQWTPMSVSCRCQT